jgi:hypothetical protein
LKPCAQPTSQIVHQDPQNSLITTPNQFYKQRIMYLRPNSSNACGQGNMLHSIFENPVQRGKKTMVGFIKL